MKHQLIVSFQTNREPQLTYKRYSEKWPKLLRKWENVKPPMKIQRWNYFSPEILYLVYGDFFNCCRWQLKTSTENVELRKQVQYLYLGQESRLDDKDYLKLKSCMTVSTTLFGRWKMLPQGRVQSRLSGAYWQEQRQWAQTEEQEISEYQETLFYCQGAWALGQTVQGSSKVSILRHSKSTWI